MSSAPGQYLPSPLVELPTQKGQGYENKRREEDKDQPPHPCGLRVLPDLTSDVCADRKISDRRDKNQRGKHWTQTGTQPQQDDARECKHRAGEVPDHDHSQRLVSDRIPLVLSDREIER